MSYNYSYNVLINRLEAFAAGHFLIKRFTHGQIDMADQMQDDEYPFMHVTPDTIEPVQGGMQFGFHIIFADIPRDKEVKTEYQREVISDCVRLGQDLIAEIRNGLQLFGFNVQLVNNPVFEPFMEEQKNTVTGVAFTIKLEVPWDWSACDIPAIWSTGGESTGGSGEGFGILLQTNSVNNQVQSLLNLVNGTNITIVDNGDGSVTINCTGGGGDTPNLQQVTDVGNTTTNDIEFGTGAGIYFNNGARVTEGTTNAGNGGYKGVALKCSVDYELKWEAGRLYVMQQDGFTIREVLHNFTFAPTVNDDDTKGYVVGSRWLLDDGSAYVCSDNTTGAAVWDLQIPGTVTSVGLSLPSPANAALSVSGTPVTTSGTLAITANGNSLQYIDGLGALQTFPDIPKKLTDLIAGTAPNQLLQWDGTDWVVIGLLTLDDLKGVNVPSPSNGQVLTYDSGSSQWIASTPAVGGTVTSVDLSMPAAFTVTNSPVTTSGTLTVTGAGLSTQYIDGTGALQTFPALSGYVPYTGATQDVDLDTFKLSASSVYIEGTAGNGHLHLKHQSADATATGQSTSLWADTNGDIKWKNDGNYKTTLKTSLNNADRIYTFPNENCELMPRNAAITGATKTKITYDADGLVTAGADIVATDVSDSTTVGQNLIKLANPSAIRYIRINADNSISALSLADLKTDLGLGTVILAADWSNAGTAGYEDVTGFSFAVTNGKTYKWRSTIAITQTATGAVAINGPTVTFNRYRFTYPSGASSNAVGNYTTYNQPTVNTTLANGVVTSDGIFKASANGTLIIRGRSSSIGGLTILAGSIIEWEEVL
jgi:hypothetical protein